MRKQIINRLGGAHIRDTIQQFVEGKIDRFQAMESLQVSKVFGSAAFVRAMATAFGTCFAAKSVGVRPVMDGEGALLPIDACATHGHRLIKAA